MPLQNVRNILTVHLFVAVDDATFRFPRAEEPHDICVHILVGQMPLVSDLIIDVGPIESCQHNLGGFQMKCINDIISYALCGSSGESHDRNLGESPFQIVQSTKSWPKVMPPRTDTMGFINGEKGKVSVLVE